MTETRSIKWLNEEGNSEIHTFACDEKGVVRWSRHRSRGDCTEDVLNDYPHQGVKLVHVRMHDGWDLLEDDDEASLRNRPAGFNATGVRCILLDDPKAIYVCLESITEQARAARAIALLTQLLACGVSEIAATEITFRLTVVSVTERERARQLRDLIGPRAQNTTSPLPTPVN